MGDFLKIIVPIFSSPKNYNEMLAKLSSFVFWQTYIYSFFIRDIKGVDKLVNSLETYGKLGAFASEFSLYSYMNAIGLVLALFVALISYAMKLHDCISDILRIRERFDAANILQPLAILIGVKLTTHQLNALPSVRDSIMRQVFYRYASSTAEKPLVEKHDIHQALNGWSWYWVLIEGAFVAVIFAIVAVWLSAYSTACIFGTLVVVLWAISRWQYGRLERLSRPQVEAIVANKEAAKEIKEQFNALSH